MTHIFSLFILAVLHSLVTCQSDTTFSLSQPFTSATQNFDTFGAAVLHSDTIVLTPHSPHVVGAIWVKKPNPHIYWEAEFSFRVSGAERGGTGIGFWYTNRRGIAGNILGSHDQWDGLGVFFDANTGGGVYFPLLVKIDCSRQ